jgi:imidazolonepropionase-like amidohydrolase
MARQVLHICATQLPYGDAPADLWIVDGHLTHVPQPDAVELAPPGGFLAPGLVDAHTHLHFVDSPTGKTGAAVIAANRLKHLRAGTLLLRDLGATADDVLGLPDDDGLPPVLAAGQSLLVESRFPFFVTSAHELPSAAAAQARAGAKWVKIFADWPGWPGTQHEPNFGPQDPLTYASATLASTVKEAHAAGARVAIHAFGYDAAKAGIDAGVDSIEHGWGLDEALLLQMAAKGIAWTPMVGIAPLMLKGQTMAHDTLPGQADWIEERLERMKTTLNFALRHGVAVLTGTDWFPTVTLADEMAMLHKLGVAPADILAMATTLARSFLHVPALDEGAPADLVLFRDDPRADLRRVARPELVMLRGQTVPLPQKAPARRLA